MGIIFYLTFSCFLFLIQRYKYSKCFLFLHFTFSFYRDISIQSALKWKHNRQTLLEKLDEDLEKAKTTVENQKSNLNEVRLIFDTPTLHPISVHQEYTKRVFELPDWRILAVASLAAFILVLIGVVAYYKWYKDTPIR